MSDPTFFIETPRLFLSYLQPAYPTHCDFLVALYNTPEFIASIGGHPTSITTREAAQKVLAGRFRDEHARNGYGTYLVSLKPEGWEAMDKLDALSASTPVGTVGLMRGEEPDCYAAPDIGFAMLSEHMRKGYTKEAGLGLMEYLEKERGLKDVFGLCSLGNEVSKAVFRSLGFEDRGERALRVFGGEVSSVWVKKGMSEDLVQDFTHNGIHFLVCNVVLLW
ncbi:including n-acetylases of ribosomal protein [Podospora aff. communis PSN243]|uniref:Including n-acetylases of ribosomal protein n=1 Tax=Podospora aff. communis PSN243 TaxID=3040156 RepID=A0AAV9G102_9PEZI|nr:including n-acetylases of ribosomal protein [Podospora aff. communis PSN243]